MIARLNALLAIAAKASSVGAVFALSVCVIVTMYDVVLRNLLNSGMQGIVDISQLTVMWAAFLAIPLGFMKANHIGVQLLTDFLPKGFAHWLAVAIALLSALTVSFISYFVIGQTIEQFEIRDRSMTAGIPLSLYWIAVAYGMTLSAFCAIGSFLYLVSGGPENKNKLSVGGL